MCIIGFKTGQLGFIPANIFCIVLSVNNLRTWRDTAAAVLISGTRPGDGGEINFTPQ
jgi:hypothetical protein